MSKKTFTLEEAFEVLKRQVIKSIEENGDSDYFSVAIGIEEDGEQQSKIESKLKKHVSEIRELIEGEDSKKSDVVKLSLELSDNIQEFLVINDHFNKLIEKFGSNPMMQLMKAMASKSGPGSPGKTPGGIIPPGMF